MRVRRGEGRTPPNAQLARNAQILRDTETMTRVQIAAKHGLAKSRVNQIIHDQRVREARQMVTV